MSIIVGCSLTYDLVWVGLVSEKNEAFNVVEAWFVGLERIKGMFVFIKEEILDDEDGTVSMLWVIKLKCCWLLSLLLVVLVV